MNRITIPTGLTETGEEIVQRCATLLVNVWNSVDNLHTLDGIRMTMSGHVDVLSLTMTSQDISDSQPPRRRRTLSFYLVFLLLVVPFWSLVPLAWAFAFYSLHSYNYQTYGVAKCVLFSVSCCEVPLLFFRGLTYSDYTFGLGHFQYLLPLSSTTRCAPEPYRSTRFR